MSDLISKQEAIDKINERQRELIYCFGFENDMVKIMDIAKSIIIASPSAQPETDGFCTDCKEYDQERHFCPRFDRVIKKTVEEMGIIHCKDCKHYNAGFECLIEGYGIERDEDWYCGDAERREDG